MRIVFIFIDGLGIGENDPVKNPCAHPAIQIVNRFQHDSYPASLPFGGIAKPIDCQLGIAGLPQSATGQTALFTGINAVQLIGDHLSGFPNQRLRELLAVESIFRKFKNMGKFPAFINAYRPIFFKFGPEALIRFLSVTSIMNWKADLHFFNFQELESEQAIYHDFTNRELIKKGFNVPLFTAEKAGQIFARVSQNYDLCLYEYFQTDHAGHAQEMSHAVSLLIQLEKFLFTFLSQTDLSHTLVLLTSDHGNIEDLAVKKHTNNPVPLIAWGNRKDDLLAMTETLSDVTPALIKLIAS